MSRWLTDEDKAAQLYQWYKLRRGTIPDRKDLGGRGFPDRDIYDLTDQLNSIEGICTVQSCAGHLPETSDGGIYPGSLWLWMEETTQDWFREHVWELVSQDCIEQAAILYGRERTKDVVEILFAGNERGRLAESSQAILKFFKGS